MSLDFKGPVDTDMPNDPYGTPVLSGCISSRLRTAAFHTERERVVRRVCVSRPRKTLGTHCKKYVKS